METKPPALRAENWMVFALGFGIFLSKPIIYATTGVLTVYFLARCIKETAYRKSAFSDRLIVTGLVIYIFGLIACLLMPTTLEELGVLARKSLYLVIFAPLILAFRQPSNRSYALTGLLVGFWVAAFMTFLQIGQHPYGRLPGATWLVDVWGVLCALFLVFLVPRVFDRACSMRLRALLAITALTALTAFVLLSLSGARGPWLSACLTIAIYLLFYQRKTLGVLLVLAVIAYFPLKHFAPTPVTQLEQRVASITDTQTNMSNWIRLTLWKLSFAHSLEKLKTNPGELLLGSGGVSHYEKVLDFFEKTDALTLAEKEQLSAPDFGYPSNDIHNLYLDSIAKHGLIWTAANIVFFIAIAIAALRRRPPHSHATLAAPALVGCFFLIGIFYSLVPHFATTFLIFFVTLASRSQFKETMAKQHG